MANEYVDRKWMREKARTKFGAADAQSGPVNESSCCSFCGAENNDVETMFSGPSASICVECVAKFQAMAGARKAKK